MKRHGHPVAALDVDGQAPTDAVFDVAGIEVVQHVRDLPHSLTLVVVFIQRLPSLWGGVLAGLLHPRFANVGMLFWECSVLPRAWIPSLALFDALVVCSNYVKEAAARAMPASHIIQVEHPLRPMRRPVDALEARRRIGLDPQALVFMSSFDLRSDHQRKNPMAVIDAFRAAFPDDGTVQLLVKANGASGWNDPLAVGAQLKAVAQADRRIIVESRTLPYDDLLMLYDAIDVYVSLHRSEGLGLGPLEAMQRGKLAIATGYSGNMSYMSDQNALLVPFDLVEPVQAAWQFRSDFLGPDAMWAEPRMADAVRLLRRARDDRDLRQRLSERARLDINAQQQQAWDGAYLRDFAQVALGTRPWLARRWLWLRAIGQEVWDPTLRKLNWLALKRRLAPR